MSNKKRHWLWNVLIVLTLVFCASAFVMHYKNWHSIEEGELSITSGIYHLKIPISEIDSISFVKRIPEMERSHGFSWMEKEKGVFQDSLTQSKVYVFVDDLRQQKIRLVHNDSLKVFLNFSDSLLTQKVYGDLNEKLVLKFEQQK
ncbi:hypothetical protein [Flagellimonas meridianipacifica]|uniref:Uncharacterized protein n=1 Tax=Flagellimonas meridianipacifica TaxID=1080225 RepID=A0A2T0MHV6_9FLAO|nr:hypothetical protein [Allomuricauda pacifica]PRX57154.1 hypothetical protein CLV81_1155 [Allomuricauda pacifica]